MNLKVVETVSDLIHAGLPEEADFVAIHGIQEENGWDLIWLCIEWAAFILLLSLLFVFLVECCSPVAGVIPDFLTSLESKGVE